MRQVGAAGVIHGVALLDRLSCQVRLPFVSLMEEIIDILLAKGSIYGP